MSAAQLLLRRLIEQSGGASETGYLLVLEGEGLEDLPAQMATPKGSYGVHRASTELGLRHLLWKAKGAPLIAVLPEELARKIQKAPDILRRARNQRVHALSVNDVLEVVLGVRVVGADARHIQELALEYVDKLGLAIGHRTLPTVVDRRLLTELLVDISVGEKVRKQSPAQLLALWLLEPPHWSKNVNQLIRDALPTMHGDEGRLLAWALVEPEIRLRQLVVHGAVLTVEAADIPKQAWGPLWKLSTEAPVELDRRILRRVAARLAEETLQALGDAAASVLTQADKVGRESLTPSVLETSKVLPLALVDRLSSLAKKAAAGKAIGANEITWLATHQAARLYKTDLAVMEVMARLSRYLDEPQVLQSTVLDQVVAYQRSGAFVELAMLQLRRALAGGVRFLTEANQLLARCRERRNRENQRFAETLAGGYEAALHSEGVTPLHRAWKRVVSSVWQQDNTGRLFVIVLDGCSYPVFLELLTALAADGTFPIGIKPDTNGRVNGMAALAPLPTITSHARGAFFLGELPNDPLVAETVFREQDEAKTDKARFNQNAALGSRTRKLFLKGDLADGGHSLLTAIQDPSLDVVAAVFNAVDDQIGSVNTGALVRIAPEDITAFKPALTIALRERRRVLLLADHGYSPYVDKEHRVGAGKTPRYLSLGKNATVPDGFLEIDLGALGGPPEKRGFAWKSGVYLGGPQVGFHGGCSLDEMAIPLVWLERDGLQADEPAWWYGQGTLGESIPPPKPTDYSIYEPIIPIETPKKNQLSLFNPEDKAPSLPLPPDVLEKLGKDERAVLVLLRDCQSARASELAEQLKKNPGRLNGLMRTLKRTLHAAGQNLFVDELLPSGETMYRYLPPVSGEPNKNP